MAIQTFSDRFVFDSAVSLTTTQIQQSSDSTLFTLLPRLKDMVDMVRRHSILLRNKTAAEIYATITQQADPSIGLRIAAARDRQGALLFPNIEVVKSIMFGPTDTNNEYISPNLNIFVDGVRGASATLAAAFLIGQLAQIREQEIHARQLEKRAYEDIDRLLQVADAEQLLYTPTPGTGQVSAFIFEEKELELQSPLQVDVFLPALANVGTLWTPVGTYNGSVSVSQIVAEIADTINGLTLNSSYSNILAAPVLASPRFGSTQLHQIDFHSRFRDLTIAAEVVTVRIRYVGALEQQPLPFRWGVVENKLAEHTVNSLIVAVQMARTEAAAAGQPSEGGFQPTVLWFRRASTDPVTGDVLDDEGNTLSSTSWENSFLTFRISPSMTEEKEVAFPNLGPAEERAGAFANFLLNQMFEIKGTTRALGALIRNDSPSQSNPLTALELIAFSATNPETWMILDLLRMPPDIQVAVGDLQRPLTPFSSRARSIRVQSRYDWRIGRTETLTAVGGNDARLVTLNDSDRLTKVQDKIRRMRGEL